MSDYHNSNDTSLRRTSSHAFSRSKHRDWASGTRDFDISTTNSNTTIHHVIVSSITPEVNIGSTWFERENVARGKDYGLHESNVLNGRIILELHRFSQRIIKQRYTAL